MSALPASAAMRDLKVTDWKVRGNPLDPQSASSIIKPGELVDVLEVTPLSLAESRIYNLLLANAWDEITQPGVHRIRKSDLRGSHDSNDRLDNAIETLMGAIAIIHHVVDGEPRKTRVQLLGPNSETYDEERGYLYYRFPAELIQIITNSTIFARLRTQIMYSFHCKYALRLYELVEKRIQLKYKSMEVFSIADFRALLGVPPKKLKRFADFNRYALKPALKEVNGLTPYYVEIGAVKRGRRVEQLEMLWGQKEREGRMAAAVELERHSSGRAARLGHTVESIAWANDE